MNGTRETFIVTIVGVIWFLIYYTIDIYTFEDLSSHKKIRKYNNYDVELKSDIREYGHYKQVASLLGLTYNLDTVFTTFRRLFLTKVIEYETDWRNPIIKDLDDMRIKLFTNI